MRCVKGILPRAQGAWRGRQNAAAALDVVDNFFTGVLSGTLQHALQDKDLDLPLHSGRAHALLAANTAAINMSYTVYYPVATYWPTAGSPLRIGQLT